MTTKPVTIIYAENQTTIHGITFFAVNRNGKAAGVITCDPMRSLAVRFRAYDKNDEPMGYGQDLYDVMQKFF